MTLANFINANALSIPLADESVQCVVTSPPYYGLRDYGTARWEGGSEGCDHAAARKKTRFDYALDEKQASNAGSDVKVYGDHCPACGATRVDYQLGLEPLHDCGGWATGNNCGACYVCHMRAVFAEVRRVLRDDGVLFLNLGDSYASQGNPEPTQSINPLRGGGSDTLASGKSRNVTVGLKPKDLVGIPWRVALALQADGWYLRQDIIWDKGNPMPESVRDRCSKSHEYVLLLSKHERYYFDSDAIRERSATQAMPEVRAQPAANRVLQEQSARGWANWQLPGMYHDPAEEVGSQVQPQREGPANSEEVLLFGEGAGNQERISQVLQADRGTEGTLSTGGQEAREGTALQGADNSILAERKGQGGEGEKRQTLRNHAGRQVLEAQDRDQAQAPDQDVRLHANPEAVAGDQGSAQSHLRLLRKEDGAAGNGSHHTAVKRGNTHSGEYSASLPDVQRQEGEQTRNARSVWHINTQPYKGAHFATYPEKLVEPCIKAGTSERGCCPKCGKPWARVVEKEPAVSKKCPKTDALYQAQGGNGEKKTGTIGMSGGGRIDGYSITTGWQPACACDAGEPITCTVLDPFAGSGTTGLVCQKLGRRFVGLDLSQEYLRLARERCGLDKLARWTTPTPLPPPPQNAPKRGEWTNGQMRLEDK